MRPQVGLVINNKYRLLRIIGEGGMGSVFEARHEVLGTSVALKFLHPELTRRAGLVQRFLQEARVSASIQSPHVVRVTDVDQTSSGLAYIVMEYLEGRTLQTLYEDLYRAHERLGYADALEYGIQILEGVDAAHRAGIVHRDLKPDNVMITRGPRGVPLIKILDFGIAKLKVSGELEKGLTRPGVVMGTPEYMAPEQAFSADAVDARADIFSLGVILFEMLAGRRPVGGDEPQQIATAYLTGQIAQLTDLAPSVSPGLAAVVHKAMAAEPPNRYASVADLRDALDPFLANKPAATPIPRPIDDAPSVAADESARISVPKTWPPSNDEPGFVDPMGARPGGTPMGGFASPGLEESGGRSPAAGSVTPVIAAQTPFAAGTDIGPGDFQPPRPGGTDVAPQSFGAQVGQRTDGYPPLGAVGGTAIDNRPASPAYVPRVEPPRAKTQKKGGFGLGSMLLMATLAAGLVVGGVYFGQDLLDDGADGKTASVPPIPLPPPTAAVTATSAPAVEPPAPTVTAPTVTTPPPPVPTSYVPPATPRPTATATKTTTTAPTTPTWPWPTTPPATTTAPTTTTRPPITIPTSFPPLFPTAPPATTTAPTTTTTGRPRITLPPLLPTTTTPPPAPTTSNTGRPRITIPVPQ